MAFAAIVSLLNTLRPASRAWNEGLFLNDQIQQIKCLAGKLAVLLEFLEISSKNSSQEVKSLEMKIREWAYHSEEAVESSISNHLLAQYRLNSIENSLLHIFMQKCPSKKLEKVTIMGLEKIMTQLDNIVEEAGKIKDWSGTQNLQPRPAPIWGETTIVGFDEDLMQIKERLCNNQQPKLQIIPIVGMGGIGKTTLARNIYNDPFVVHHFYIRAWIILSPHYRLREILLSLLVEIGVRTDDQIMKESDDKLTERIYKIVKGNRFVVVLDDVWSANAWNGIKMLFPDDNNGSRILLTTRLTDVAEYVSSFQTNCHLMRFLNEEQSWNLFRQKVFGEESCPPELVDVGMRIAKNCQGLPLVIVVIGRLLSNAVKAIDYWEYVAGNLSSIIAENDGRCFKILTLSYNNLPPYLKPCFLYMGAFPEKYEIPVSRLIKLWVAEGFVNPYMTQYPEEFAERYLKQLIGRNLILVGQEGSIKGKIKTCHIHGVLRELCVRMAHEDNILYVKSRHQCMSQKQASFEHRLCIHDNSSYSCSEEENTVRSMHLVRSFIYNGYDDTQLHSYCYFGYLLLRVLDMVGVELGRFPEEILQLVNLRYIAIACHAEIPGSIVLLWNLQSLVVIDRMGIASKLPEEIWNMLRLRHLKFSRVFLPPFNPEQPFTFDIIYIHLQDWKILI